MDIMDVFLLMDKQELEKHLQCKVDVFKKAETVLLEVFNQEFSIIFLD